MKTILVSLAMLVFSGCGHTSDTQKALEAGNKTERGSWVKPNTTLQQTWIDYSMCGNGILYTKEGFSLRDYENDLPMCIQANIDRDGRITNLQPWVPGVGFATLSVERCMNAKGYRRLERDDVKSASADETTECMKAKAYEWK